MFLKKLLVFFLISLSSSSLILFSQENCTASQNSALYKNILPFIDLKILEEEYLVQQSWIIYPGGSVNNIRMPNKNTRTAVNFNNNTGRTTRSGHWSYPHPCASQVIAGKK
ncbi:MAG: hypothetical protein GY757_17480, partial [bacterium]|nr:hypothetical protein [bacterium]